MEENKKPPLEVPVQEVANFSPLTGEKLHQTCECWVKKESYNCGQTKCPGYTLIVKG